MMCMGRVAASPSGDSRDDSMHVRSIATVLYAVA